MKFDKRLRDNLSNDELTEIEGLFHQICSLKEQQRDLEETDLIMAYDRLNKEISSTSKRLRDVIGARIEDGGVSMGDGRYVVKISSSSLQAEIIDPEMIDDGILDDIREAEVKNRQRYLVTTVHPKRLLELLSEFPDIRKDLEDSGALKLTRTATRSNVSRAK